MIKIWDLKTYEIKVDLRGYEVYCVGFVADKVVSSGRDKTVKMWVLLLSYLLGFWVRLVDGRIRNIVDTQIEEVVSLLLRAIEGGGSFDFCVDV